MALLFLGEVFILCMDTRIQNFHILLCFGWHDLEIV